MPAHLKKYFSYFIVNRELVFLIIQQAEAILVSDN